MIANNIKEIIANSSSIRAMFEEGQKMAEIYGAENVQDFSLGNPNLPAPDIIKESIIDIVEQNPPQAIHSYMNNLGYEDVRQTVADSLNKRFETDFSSQNIVMTVGAAGGIHIVLRSLINPEDEILVFAPFFGEYQNYALNVSANLIIVPPNPPSFLPNLEAFKKAISKKTKIVIINTPNNPTGVIYPESTIQEISAILNEKQKEFQTDIYLLSDEPYRELVYDAEIVVPYVTKYYENTIVAYSWSKSLSLPGERIGYLVVPTAVSDFELLMQALNVSNRILGFVNAPSLLQKVVARCIDETGDIDFYKRNRDMLYHALVEYGYECVKPDGAFYLWVKSPLENALDFVNMAKKYQLLFVTGSTFACDGYVRLAYCVSPETIQKALPKFQQLMKDLQ